MGRGIRQVGAIGTNGHIMQCWPSWGAGDEFALEAWAVNRVHMKTFRVYMNSRIIVHEIVDRFHAPAPLK